LKTRRLVLNLLKASAGLRDLRSNCGRFFLQPLPKLSHFLAK
jgi:hypothetical protein